MTQTNQSTSTFGVLFALLVLCLSVFYLLQRVRGLDRRCEGLEIKVQNTVSIEYFKAWGRRTAVENQPVHQAAGVDASVRSAVHMVDMMAAATAPFSEQTQCGAFGCVLVSQCDDNDDMDSPLSPRVTDVTDAPDTDWERVKDTTEDASWNEQHISMSTLPAHPNVPAAPEPQEAVVSQELLQESPEPPQEPQEPPQDSPRELPQEPLPEMTDNLQLQEPIEPAEPVQTAQADEEAPGPSSPLTATDPSHHPEPAELPTESPAEWQSLIPPTSPGPSATRDGQSPRPGTRRRAARRR